MPLSEIDRLRSFVAKQFNLKGFELELKAQQIYSQLLKGERLLDDILIRAMRG